MSNPLKQLQNVIIQSKPIVSCYLGEKETLGLKDEIEQGISDNKIHVMLYGAYNSGKSTLVNVLLGKEKARVNDIPTTDKVDLYQWNGVGLLDTPGVNAPIQHEEATQEQIKRSDLMLFVIREGDQDSKDLYERLFEILKKDKKVFIVLNHQIQNIDNLVVAHQKISTILLRMAGDYGVTDKQISDIPILSINLKTAFLGRRKSSDKLLNHSGYGLFINSFKSWVVRHDSEYSHINLIKNMIMNLWVLPTLEKIYEKQKSGDTSIVRGYQIQRSTLENKKGLLLRAIQNFIRQKVGGLRGDILIAIQNSNHQSELESKMYTIFNPLVDHVHGFLEKEVGDINASLDFNINPKLISEEGQGSSRIGDLVLDTSKDLISNPDNIKKALILGRKLKMPGLKGRWGTTFGKWADKAGPVVQVAFALYDIWSEGKAEDEHNARQRQSAIATHQAVEQVCLEVEGTLYVSALDEITEIFDKNISVIQQKIDDITDSCNVLETDLEGLLKFRDSVNSISAMAWDF